MTERLTCPRRIREDGPWRHEKDLDAWVARGGLPGQAAAGPSCSFCGSLHPDRFMALAALGWIIGPTDEAHKAYLSSPVSLDVAEARRKSWMSAPCSAAAATRSLKSAAGASEQEITEALDRQWSEDEEPMLRGSTEATFYYQHLSGAQRRKFTEMHDAGELAIGWPGSFYVAPFFLHRGEWDE